MKEIFLISHDLKWLSVENIKRYETRQLIYSSRHHSFANALIFLVATRYSDHVLDHQGNAFFSIDKAILLKIKRDCEEKKKTHKKGEEVESISQLSFCCNIFFFSTVSNTIKYIFTAYLAARKKNRKYFQKKEKSFLRRRILLKKLK